MSRRPGQAAPGFGLAVVCRDTQGARPLRELLAAPRPARALVVVGPRAGSPPRSGRPSRPAASRLSLGPTVLRIETAATVAAGALSVAWL